MRRNTALFIRIEIRAHNRRHAGEWALSVSPQSHAHLFHRGRVQSIELEVGEPRSRTVRDLGMFHGFEVRMVHHEGDGGKDGKSRQTALPAELANALADLVRKHADPNLGVDLRGNRLLFLSRDGRLLKGIREAFANPIDEPVTRG